MASVDTIRTNPEILGQNPEAPQTKDEVVEAQVTSERESLMAVLSAVPEAGKISQESPMATAPSPFRDDELQRGIAALLSNAA